MTDLVACVGEGKGTWTNVLMLAANPQFKNVFLIVNNWTKNSLKLDNPKIKMVVVDDSQNVSAIRDSIVSQMRGKINDLEVALNLDSGSGKEHMAIITAIMRLGLSFRIVTFENNNVQEVTYDLEVQSEID